MDSGGALGLSIRRSEMVVERRNWRRLSEGDDEVELEQWRFPLLLSLLLEIRGALGLFYSPRGRSVSGDHSFPSLFCC